MNTEIKTPETPCPTCGGTREVLHVLAGWDDVTPCPRCATSKPVVAETPSSELYCPTCKQWGDCVCSYQPAQTAQLYDEHGPLSPSDQAAAVAHLARQHPVAAALYWRCVDRLDSSQAIIAEIDQALADAREAAVSELRTAPFTPDFVAAMRARGPQRTGDDIASAKKLLGPLAATLDVNQRLQITGQVSDLIELVRMQAVTIQALQQRLAPLPETEHNALISLANGVYDLLGTTFQEASDDDA